MDNTRNARESPRYKVKVYRNRATLGLGKGAKSPALVAVLPRPLARAAAKRAALVSLTTLFWGKRVAGAASVRFLFGFLFGFCSCGKLTEKSEKTLDIIAHLCYN